MVQRGAPRGGKLRALGILVFAAVMLAAFVAASLPGSARADDIFTVTGVPVDVTADSATAAREQALLEGQRKAARMMLERLTLKQDSGSLPAIGDAQLLDIVQGIEVESEKISNVRYLGSLTVRFRPDAIRSLLRTANVRYAETVSKPLVVVPVYHGGDTSMLWDEANPWLAAWGSHVAKGGLVPLIVPLGDLTDMSAITADDAAQGVGAKLEALARRYSATDTLVVVATTAADGTGVDIAATRYGGAQQERTDVLRVAGTPGETTDALLGRAVAEVQAQVEEGWKQENILHFDQEQMLSVTVPLRDLAEWVGVRKKLGDVAYIRSAEIVALTKAQAIVGLHYIGDTNQLKLALAQKDLDLTQEGESWTLRPAAAESAPAAAPGGASAPDSGAAVPGATPAPESAPASPSATGTPAPAPGATPSAAPTSPAPPTPSP
jgi:hypothetical protein